MKTWIAPSLSIVACLGVISLASCGSDSPSTPVDTAPQPGHVYTYAGTGRPGYGPTGQAPAKTQLYWPQDVAFGPDGKAVVLDWNNHRVISVDANGHFKLIVGVADGDFGDPCPADPAPCDNILATNAKLNHPTHVAFDANGDMVLCAWHNSDLFLLNVTSGLMNRICGTGNRPCFGPVSADPQAAITACIDLPASVAFDPQGRLCFTDQANMIIRRIEDGTIETVAGTQPQFDVNTGKFSNIQFGYSGDGGPATSAKLSFERGQIADPSGKICFDPAGNMYIADTKNHCVRVVDTSGIINTFAGHPTVSGYGGDGELAISADVYLTEPRDVASDTDGNIFIADTGNNVIRQVDTNGVISTVVGVARPINSLPLVGDEVLKESGYLAADVHLTGPSGIEVDSKGRLFIADTQNNVVRVLYR